MIMLILWCVILAMVGFLAALSIFRWIDGTIPFRQCLSNIIYCVIMAFIGCNMFAIFLEDSGVANPSVPSQEKAETVEINLDK